MRDRTLRYTILLLVLLGAFLLLSAFMPARIGGDDQILVWTAPASEPGRESRTAPGDLALLDGEGSLRRLMSVPEGADRIEACGQNALSPNGDHFAFFMGQEVSTRGVGFYVMSGNRLPERIENIHPLACWGGSGPFAYAPNSERMAYIVYESGAHLLTFARGTLTVRRTNSDYDREAAFENAVTFELFNDGMAFVTFGVNQFNQADEAILNWWDGSTNREVISLTTNQGCQYADAAVKKAGGYYWIGLAERCPNGTEWGLFRVESDGSNALLALRQNPRGAISPAAQTDMLIFARDASQFFYMLPDGLAVGSAGLYRVPVNDLFAVTPLVENGVAMPILSGSSMALPVFSPDGRWFALASRTRSGESSVQVIDLENPGSNPVTAGDFEGGDVILFMAFTKDSDRLIFIAGGDGGRDNGIFSLDVDSRELKTVVRGTFSHWAQLSPDGDELAVLEYIHNDDAPSRYADYLNLYIVDLDNGQRETLFDGLTDEPGNQFAVPLLWLR